MKVFLHTRGPLKRDWSNEEREFGRIPVLGEFIATSSTSPWYKVELVVHCPFPCEFEAEVYAVEIDHTEVKQAAFIG